MGRPALSARCIEKTMGAHLVSAAVGIWLMAAPAVLGYGDPAATSDRIVGPLVASFALIALWEVTRAIRWVNVVLAAWMILAPVLLGYEHLAFINSVSSGLMVGGLSLVRGRTKHSFAGGWRSLWGHSRLGEEGTRGSRA